MKIYDICYYFVKLFKLIWVFIVLLNMFFLICWCVCINIWIDNYFVYLFDRFNRKKKERKKDLISFIKINNWIMLGLSFFKVGIFFMYCCFDW